MDSCGAAEASSSSLRTASCDLLSHTLAQPITLLPHAHGQRARFHLSDRKLSLQERSQSSAPSSDPPGLGRYIYPSLPYSPVTSPHTSPRLPRRPTVESHSVSITDLQVGGGGTLLELPQLSSASSSQSSARFPPFFSEQHTC